MNDGKHCPSCDHDIGIWAIFSAGWPSRIFCPSCGARLSYQAMWGVFLVLCVLALLTASASYYATVLLAASFLTDQTLQVVVFFAICFAAWCIVELLMTLYLRGNKILKKWE
jgi:hypothetical protein